MIAQILRLGSMAYAVQSKDPVIPPESLKKIRQRLLFYQFTSDCHQTGGFMYGSDEDSQVKTHLNAWVSMFALQALWMHDTFVVHKKPLQLESFV